MLNNKWPLYQNPQNNDYLYAHNFKQVIDTISLHKGYKPNSQSLLEEFKANADNAAVREALLCMLLVDLIDSQENHQDNYTIPPTNIKRCTMGTLISPILTAYKGDLTSTVIAAMCTLVIDNVPDDRDAHNIWVIAEHIRHFAIEGRNIIKTKLSNSLKPNATTAKEDAQPGHKQGTTKAKIENMPVHIANVSCSITWALNSDLKITVPLQVRLVFLHAILTGNNFTGYWSDVDNRLRKWEADYGNQLSA
ncbi:hypothetical protein K439DRAFT_1623680 [Ramaria rubella]|nr:hypothetical protein K439DRAFT_1623680 [Ramaria rubella]